MYTFSFVKGNSIPKSVKCILSATKNSSDPGGGGVVRSRPRGAFSGLGFRNSGVKDSRFSGDLGFKTTTTTTTTTTPAATTTTTTTTTPATTSTTPATTSTTTTTPTTATTGFWALVLGEKALKVQASRAFHLGGFGFTYSLHCSSFFWVYQFYS